ncbi:hypothetical protein L218DRAFT_950036 [Marasmius fiardii PR-910]|nr:hypothetical protein L218DRAFT_950036 [Marasmius fiardii PR-910]
MPQRKPDRAIIIVSGYGTIKAKVGDMREDKKRRDSKEKEILQRAGSCTHSNWGFCKPQACHASAGVPQDSGNRHSRDETDAGMVHKGISGDELVPLRGIICCDSVNSIMVTNIHINLQSKIMGVSPEGKNK